MDVELLDLMPHTITYEPRTSKDKWRDGSYGTAVTYSCYIEPVKGEMIVRSRDGKERKASWLIYVGTTTVLDPEGRLTLPTGFDPQQPPFFSVAQVADENGINHLVVTV